MIRWLTFPEAVNLALTREMEVDPRVFCFGVDVQDHKRTFGSGQGLVERFPGRYFGSPLSAAGATGIALGAALAGMRPVHIHARADFLLLAMNQLCNVASAKRYLSGGRLAVPLTVRAIVGRSWGQGAQHSKTMHGTLAHFPGLKVVLPATPQDGYSLLRGAIQDDNPVVVLEHRWLYGLTGEVDDEVICPPGRCRVAREGRDLTLVGVSWMTQECLHAADILARVGVEAEVVDVRSAAPLDMLTIMDSVVKTKRVIIVDNDWPFCGLSAEIAAQITTECFRWLKDPPRRIGWAPCPCPTTYALEQQFYPSAREIVRAAEGMLGLKEMDVSGEKFAEYATLFRGPF